MDPVLVGITIKITNNQIKNMNIFKFIVLIAVSSADLIGYNRLGNNVNGHYQAKMEKRGFNSNSYYRQLRKYAASMDGRQSEDMKSFVESKKIAKPRMLKKNLRRRLYMYNMMRA